MRLHHLYCLSGLNSPRSALPDTFHPPLRTPASQKKRRASLSTSDTLDHIYDAWLASRVIPERRGAYLVPGNQRPFNRTNAKLALVITKLCAYDLFKTLIYLNPARTMLMLCLNVLRSLSPAFRGYWQALALNELQSLITSGKFTWTYLLRLIVTELLRRFLEGLVDSLATSNENTVQSSARFFVEYQQMEQRVRLDFPTLSDPLVRDLLQESELFTRSFHGMGGFGLLSPFDLMHILSLFTEVLSHIWVVLSLTGSSTHFGILLFSVFSTLLPFFVSWLGISWPLHSNSLYTPREAHAAERQERMRNLVYSDSHRPEILLFGLGPWIMSSWAAARKVMLTTEQPTFNELSWPLSLLSNVNFSDFLCVLQNIPLVLVLQSSSTSLGAFTLYRSSVQSVVFAVRNLVTTVRMAFQGVFFMGAFCAAMKIRPRLHPKKGDCLDYQGLPGGAKIEVRNLCYTFPGNKQPTLKNINLTIEAGESLAIVGYNGSGKSTLAKILLRILDFDEGELLINGVDIRRYNPVELHRHVTGVFQGFSKYNSTVKENVGVGFVEKLGSLRAVQQAMQLGGADRIVDSLPNGLRTRLDTAEFDPSAYASFADAGRSHIPAHTHHGLSGGEWQRIAISRAFMRANRPEIDLLLFDEPTSSLDAHAQNNVFDTIEKISRLPSGERIKTVIFITHRLSIARRADKIAMMENGSISEFGSHAELLQEGGSYAALYHASV